MAAVSASSLLLAHSKLIQVKASLYLVTIAAEAAFSGCWQIKRSISGLLSASLLAVRLFLEVMLLLSSHAAAVRQFAFS